MEDDNSQEFIAGPEIKFIAVFSSEHHSMIKEWLAIVPTLYLLDICVVSATKLTEESLVKDPRKAALIDELRFLDRPNNCFSYFCALMEKVSDSRGILTHEELKVQVLDDLSVMRKFFKNARVPESDDFAISFLESLKGEPIEGKRTEYLSFLRTLNDELKLQNTISSTQRLAKAKEIIQKADDLTISRQHPIVAIALACIYGNRAAKKLMKFKDDKNKFDAENALSDIVLISRFAPIKLEMEHHGNNGVGYANVKFITDDDGLSRLINHFKPATVKHQDHVDGRITQLTMTVELEELLTEIENDEYQVILDLLASLENSP